MFQCICACVTSLLLFSIVHAEAPSDDNPSLKGRWQLVSLVQDEQAASAKQLKGAYVDVTDDLMVFHVPSKPKFPDLHIKYEFGPEGIDMQMTDSRDLDYSGPPIYGNWSYKDGQFMFAHFDTDDVKARPPVAPAKSVIYYKLKRELARKKHTKRRK